MDLAQKKCVACEGNVAPYNRVEAETLLQQVNGWELSGDAKQIAKAFSFANFAEALAFANEVGAIAESEGGLNSVNVDVSYRWSMSWFIFSEIMFFGAFFSALFYARSIAMPKTHSVGT